MFESVCWMVQGCVHSLVKTCRASWVPKATWRVPITGWSSVSLGRDLAKHSMSKAAMSISITRDASSVFPIILNVLET